MTPEELKIIEDRCSKATPGPWSAIRPDTTTSNWYISRRPGEGEDGFYISCIFTGKEDADFVTRSREDIPKLLNYIKELESQIPKWVHVIDTPPKENEEVLFGLFDPITQIFQGYMRNGHIFSDSHENSFLPVRGMYWQVLPGLPENIYKDLEG